MTPLQAIILGVIQGVFEWLPVSSEAIITLVMTNFYGSGVINSVNTAVWLHSGTMLAATVYFRDEILGILDISWKNKHSPIKLLENRNETSIIRFLFFSTLVTGIIGGTIYVFGLEEMVGNPDMFSGLTALALFVTGGLRLYRTKDTQMFMDVDDKDSILIGVLQGLSVLPGVSRSGSTVFGFFLREYNAEDAFRLSFLMSIPAILIANIGINLFSGFSIKPIMILSAAIAFFVGYGTIEFVLKFAERSEIGIICFILGFISLVPIIL
jgi:Uncharacterized bacitracin resistance protein